MPPRHVTLALCVTLWMGCASLPVTNAVWSPGTDPVPESAWTQDQASGLEWWVANDAQTLSVRVGIRDRLRQMLARRAGLTLYLSPDRSKDEGMFVRYPFMAEPAAMGPTEGMSQPSFPLSTDLLWQRGKDQEILNPHLERTSFKADIYRDGSDRIVFSFRIPLDSLRTEDGQIATTIALGIEFHRLDRPSDGMNIEGGGRGGRPGGRSGEPPGGGRAGGGTRGGRGERGQEPTSVWFQAVLAAPTP